MFLNPLGLLALLGVPVLVAVHLYRRRFRRRTVSAVFLWQEHESSTDAGRTRVPLQRSASFWLELAAVVAAALLVAQPRGCAEGEREHVVVVLDGSASLTARGAAGPVADRVRDVAAAEIRSVAPGGRITLLQTGSAVQVLAGPRAAKREAAAALSRYEPSAAGHSPAAALDLARDLAEGGRVLWLTDKPGAAADRPEVEEIALGEPLPNLAFVQALRRREGTGDRVFLIVRNLAGRTTAASLKLLVEGEELIVRDLMLPADDEEHLALALPPNTGVVEALLEPAEPELNRMGLDDRVLLAPPPRRALRVASTLTGAEGSAVGITATGRDGAVERFLRVAHPAEPAVSPGAAHIVFGGPAAGGDSSWVMSPMQKGEARRTLTGPFLLERAHPLLRGVELSGVLWTYSPRLELEGRPLISAGPVPLLTEGLVGDRRVYRWNLDPARSTLRRSPDWPILLSNLAEIRRAELPGAERGNVSVGETIVVRGAGPGPWKVAGPGRPRVAADEDLVIDGLTAPGVVRVSGPEGLNMVFGVNMVDAAESDLSDRGSGERPSATPAATLRAEVSGLDSGLLLLLLLLVAADWWTLGRATEAAA